MHRLTLEYKDDITKYEDFRYRIEILITELLKQHNVSFHKIESRIKDISKLEEKIIRKNEKYSTLNEITDLVGIRIITYFENEVDKISEILNKEFIIDYKNSIDKRNLEADKFGYRSLHNVVSLNYKRKKLTEYIRFKNLKLEIQVRSILQHAWAEIEHDLGYKSELSIPDDLRRNFFRVAALLETADIEFVNIRSGLKKYETTVIDKIKNNPEHVEINLASLKSFIFNNDNVEYIEKEMSKKTKINLTSPSKISNVNVDELYIKRLRFIGIYTIGQLEDSLYTEKENIIKFATAWIGNRKGGSFERGISIFYLCYVLTAKKNNLEFANEYYKKLINIRNSSSPLGRKIIEVYNEISDPISPNPEQ